MRFRTTSKHESAAKPTPFDRARRVLSVCIGFSFWSPQWTNRDGLYHKNQDFRRILHFRRTSKHRNGAKLSLFDRAYRVLSLCIGYTFWSSQCENRGGVHNKIQDFRRNLHFKTHPCMEIERNRVPSTELVDVYRFVQDVAFGFLNVRIVVEFTIKSRILEGICILGRHLSMEMKSSGSYSIEPVEFYVFV